MKINVNRKLATFIGVLVLVVGAFFITPSARADWPSDVMSGLLSIVISALGVILIVVVQALIYVAQYQNFLDSEVVILGWVIVRDICNMFFVVVLMIIAFGTILNIPNYSYKKWLPKLILFAILINFSKTICGLMIDIAQVVMLTFVNAFKDIGGANLTEVLGITDIVTMEEAGNNPSFWTIVGAYVLGLIYLLVAIVVLVTMIMVLVMRLVMIWIYVVLSPAAYLLSAFPGGQSYASKWWSDFIKNLIVGPVLAFFIWLSLASLNADQTIKNMGSGVNLNNELNRVGSGLSSDQGGSALPTKAGQPSALIKFVIGIGMLVGGLMISQQIGGAAGGLAGKGMSALQKGKKLALGGVAAVTGYRYASGVAKQYAAMRKAKREDSYKDSAVKLAGGIGRAKQLAPDLAKKGYNIGRDYFANKIAPDEKSLDEAKIARDNARRAQTNFDTKKGDVNGYTYNETEKKWQDGAGNEVEEFEVKENLDDYVQEQTKEADNKERRSIFGIPLGLKGATDRAKFHREEAEKARFNFKNKEGAVGNLTYDKEKGAWKDKKENIVSDEGAEENMNNYVANHNEQAKYQENRADAIRKRQSKVKKFAKGAAYVAGGGAALLTGGLPGLGIAAAAAKLGHSFTKAGQVDLGLASGFKLKKVSEEKGEMKNDSDEKVVSVMNDLSASAFARTAAALEAMERKLLSSEQAVVKRKEIQEDMGGSNQDGSWKDKKLGGYVDGVIDKNYPAARTVFEDMASKDPNKQAKARREIYDNFEQGHYSLDLDTGALKESIELLVKAMKTGDFVAQFKQLKDSTKKDAIIKQLDASQSFEAKEKLFRVKDLDFAFKNYSGDKQAGKEKALSGLSFDNLLEIFNKGSDAQQKAIINAVRDSGATDKVKLFKNAETALNNGSAAAGSLRRSLGL